MSGEGRSTNPLEGAAIALCAREPEELEPIAALLREMGGEVHVAESIAELEALVGKRRVDVVLVHICPSRREFMDVLGHENLPPVVPLLCFTDRGLYLETLRRGAFDCVPLPADRQELERVLTLAISGRQRCPRSAA